MSNRLSVCAGCERHVKRGDDVCPFCGRQQAPGREVPAVQPIARMSRAALLTLGTGAVLVTTALGVASCADAPAPTDDSGEGAKADEGDSSQAALTTAHASTEEAPGIVVAMYGAPPPEEVDAGPPRPPVSAYGGPPVDPGSR